MIAQASLRLAGETWQVSTFLPKGEYQTGFQIGEGYYALWPSRSEMVAALACEWSCNLARQQGAEAWELKRQADAIIRKSDNRLFIYSSGVIIYKSPSPQEHTIFASSPTEEREAWWYLRGCLLWLAIQKPKKHRLFRVEF